MNSPGYQCKWLTKDGSSHQPTWRKTLQEGPSDANLRFADNQYPWKVRLEIEGSTPVRSASINTGIRSFPTTTKSTLSRPAYSVSIYPASVTDYTEDRSQICDVTESQVLLVLVILKASPSSILTIIPTPWLLTNRDVVPTSRNTFILISLS